MSIWHMRRGQEHWVCSALRGEGEEEILLLSAAAKWKDGEMTEPGSSQRKSTEVLTH